VIRVTRFAAYAQIFLPADNLHQTFAKNRVVLDNEYLPAAAIRMRL